MPLIRSKTKAIPAAVFSWRMSEPFTEHPAEMGVALEPRVFGNLLQRQIAVKHLLLGKL